jgi:hypothetical protein
MGPPRMNFYRRERGECRGFPIQNKKKLPRSRR